VRTHFNVGGACPAAARLRALLRGAGVRGLQAPVNVLEHEIKRARAVCPNESQLLSPPLPLPAVGSTW
jgi:hypothetical protein